MSIGINRIACVGCVNAFGNINAPTGCTAAKQIVELNQSVDLFEGDATMRIEDRLTIFGKIIMGAFGVLQILQNISTIPGCPLNEELQPTAYDQRLIVFFNQFT